MGPSALSYGVRILASSVHALTWDASDPADPVRSIGPWGTLKFRKRQRQGWWWDVPDDADVMGPISYLIVEFPGSKMTGEGLPILLDLVDRGLIRIVDLVFVNRGADGSLNLIEVGDIDHDGQFDFALFAGASSGLLDEGDLADAASVIQPGSSAAILIFENRWATPFVQALRRGKAELVAAGYIPQDALLTSLETAER